MTGVEPDPVGEMRPWRAGDPAAPRLRRLASTSPAIAASGSPPTGRLRRYSPISLVGVLALSASACGSRTTSCTTGEAVESHEASVIERIAFSREEIFGEDEDAPTRVLATAWLDGERLLCVAGDVVLIEIHVPSRTVKRRRLSWPDDATITQDGVQAMAVGEGRHLALGTAAGSVVVYDLYEGRRIGETSLLWESDGIAYACAWQTSGEVLAANMFGRIRAYQPPGLKERVIYPNAGGYVDFGPGGHILVPWGKKLDAVLLDPAGESLWRIPPKSIDDTVRYYGATSSDGRYTAMARYDREIDLVELHPTEGVARHQMSSRKARVNCEALSFVPGMHELVVAWDRAIEVFNVRTLASVCNVELGDVNLSGWPRATLSVSSSRYVVVSEPSHGLMVFRISDGSSVVR